jgi:hypothetical protein
MNKQIFQIPTEADTHLYLQIAETAICNSETGEQEPHKELALELHTDTGAAADGEQVTFLSKRGIDALIAKLMELKDQITY